MKKQIITIMIAVFLLSSVIAANTNTVQTLGAFEKLTPINLKQTCGNCTFVNITSIEYTTKSQMVHGQVEMTKVGTEYQYVLPSTNTSLMGRYIVNGFGDIDGINTVFAYDLYITADGKMPSSFPTELILLIIAYVILFVGIILNKSRIPQFVASVLLIILGTITLFPGYSYIDYSTLFGLTLGIISVGIGLYYLFENSFSYQRQVRGFDQDDDGRYYND